MLKLQFSPQISLNNYCKMFICLFVNDRLGRSLHLSDMTDCQCDNITIGIFALTSRNFHEHTQKMVFISYVLSLFIIQHITSLFFFWYVVYFLSCLQRVVINGLCTQMSCNSDLNYSKTIQTLAEHQLGALTKSFSYIYVGNLPTRRFYN